MKKIVILGSTGSLGTQALEVLKKYKKEFQVIGLCANNNRVLLEKQAKQCALKKNIVLASRDGRVAVNNLAKLKEADIILNVLSGTSGIVPTKTALKAGKILILGNKESLVADGDAVMGLVKHRDQLIPLDSEHNSIYEIIKANPEKKIKKIIIPCSGGPFLGRTKAELKNITVAQALAHPKWSMGAKINIESATLLNKGLEVVEAYYLFGLPFNKIDVKIHPQCKIHGIVEFYDTSLKGAAASQQIAYISNPDMKEHIENTLLRAIQKTPKNSQKAIRALKPTELLALNPDHKAFPGIKLVLKAFNKEKTPTKRAANMKSFLKEEEKVIAQFLKDKIKFQEIFSNLQ